MSHLLFTAARKILRGRLGQFCLVFLFRYMSFAIPAKKLVQTDTLIAFYHPQPVYPLHILIVPRKAIPGLQALDRRDQELLAEIFQTAQQLVEELGLYERGYRLIVNGGLYQELPQLHFHLVSE